MEFRILGPLQVLDDGRELPLGPPKERELLAVLLLHAGAVVSRDRLSEELWGESPPPTAGKALNVHVSQLRKTLAHNGHNPVATQPPGYVLAVEPETVDAIRFERLVAEARERVATGEVDAAGRLLREALALWRGRALDGVELQAAAHNEVRRLEELRLAAQMDRIDCELSLGSHEELIGELEALVAEHPLRERLRGQLMLALYRSGRQADALRCYREARETLVGELGIEPSVPMQRLERGILNHDASLEAPAGVARVAAADPARTRTRVPEAASGGAAVLARRRRALSRRFVGLSALILVVAASGVVAFRAAEGEGLRVSQPRLCPRAASRAGSRTFARRFVCRQACLRSRLAVDSEGRNERSPSCRPADEQGDRTNRRRLLVRQRDRDSRRRRLGEQRRGSDRLTDQCRQQSRRRDDSRRPVPVGDRGDG